MIVKNQVWIAYAKFEMTNPAVEGINNVELARRIYERGNKALKSSGDKESRALLLEAFGDFENEFGDDKSREKITAKLPKRIKRRRRIVSEDGVRIYFFDADKDTVL